MPRRGGDAVLDQREHRIVERVDFPRRSAREGRASVLRASSCHSIATPDVAWHIRLKYREGRIGLQAAKRAEKGSESRDPTKAVKILSCLLIDLAPGLAHGFAADKSLLGCQEAHAERGL